MRSRYAALAAFLLLMGCTATEDSGLPPAPPPDASQQPQSTRPAPSASKPDPAWVPPELAKYCHTGFPLEGVWSPHRLTVKQRCVAVTGIASAIKREHDGDMHISLTGVNPKWLNAVNRQRANQSLVVEVVPSIPMKMPPLSSRVTVVGPWVLDTQTGWLEIHPVWAILPA